MPIEGTDVVYVSLRVVKAPPLVQAAASRGRGILRIQGQQDHLVTLRGLQLHDRLTGKRMPVAHGHKAAHIHALTGELGFERLRLAFGEAADRRTPADGRVVMLYLAG